ncbi:hypothetical protein E8E11_008883 [Didymella keratinophila]|nr:hypothetical protein E8E11_008883 [Didymella keratinophila]
MDHVWQMPVYREPEWLETMIHDFLSQVQELLEQLMHSCVSSNEILAYWWEPYRRPAFVLLIILGIILIWLIMSNIATQRALQAHAASKDKAKTTVSAPSICKVTVSSRSPPETPERRRAVQALNDNEENDSPSAIGTHVPFGIGKTVNGRTGRVSTSGYQTPFAKVTGRHKFAYLAKDAPDSYYTLRQKDLLNAVGTPTKKGMAILSVQTHAAADDDEYVQVFDSPTRSYGRVRKSILAPKEVQRQAEGV